MVQDYHKPNGSGSGTGSGRRYYRDDSSSRRHRPFHTSPPSSSSSSSPASRNYNSYHSQHHAPGHFPNENPRLHNPHHFQSHNPYSSRRSGSQKSFSTPGNWQQAPSHNNNNNNNNNNGNPSFSSYRRPSSQSHFNPALHTENIHPPPTGPSRRISITNQRDVVQPAASNSLERPKPKFDPLADFSKRKTELNLENPLTTPTVDIGKEDNNNKQPVNNTKEENPSPSVPPHTTTPSIIQQEISVKQEHNVISHGSDAKQTTTVISKQEEKHEKKEEEDEENDSTSIYDNIKSCIFPMNKVELKVWELKHAPMAKRREHLKYLKHSKLNTISQYSFVDESFLIFKQADAHILHNAFMETKDLLDAKKSKLTDQYVYLNNMWQKDCANYDKQLEKTYDNGSSEKDSKVTVDEPTVPAPPTRTSSSRRSRHHGDSVRTEAEFMEILASLEQERERDPLVRAQYGAALIPDMLMDPVEKYSFTRVMDSNNLISDKNAWASRVLSDPIDTFTEAEHAKFTDIYINHPKKFGRISHELGGLRTSEECVLHYYKTKKSANYKQLVANKNKRAKKKSLKKKNPKSRSDTTANSDTSAVDIEQNKSISDEIDNMEGDDSAKSTGDLIKSAAPSTSKDLLHSTTKTIEEAKVNGISAAEEDAEGRDDSEVAEPIEDRVNEEAPIEDDNATEIGVDDDTNNNNNVINVATKHSLESDESATKVQKVSDTIHSPSHVAQGTAAVAPRSVSPHTEQIAAIAGLEQTLESKTETETETENETDHDKKSRRKHKDNHISSYWSVQDITTFPVLLQKYGSKWDIIAEKIGTKTATMVKNYFQRGLVDHSEWQTLIMMSSEANNVQNPYQIPPVDQSRVDRPSQLPFPQAQPHQHGQYQTQPLQPPANGPSMGYFIKPENAYSTSFPRPQLSSILPPQRPQMPQMGQLYSQFPGQNTKTFENSQQIPPLPNPLLGNRNHALSSILNSGSEPSPIVRLPQMTTAPSFVNGSIQSAVDTGISEHSGAVKRPRIMDLLNSDEPDGSEVTPKTQSFKSNINTIMNSSLFPVDPRSQISHQPLLQQQLQPQPQPQPQPQQQPHLQPQPHTTQPSNFMGGTSALDALARIAFERK